VEADVGVGVLRQEAGAAPRNTRYEPFVFRGIGNLVWLVDTDGAFTYGVLAPLLHVAMHVVQAPRVRRIVRGSGRLRWGWSRRLVLK
jgi:hypothetical protein